MSGIKQGIGEIPSAAAAQRLDAIEKAGATVKLLVYNFEDPTDELPPDSMYLCVNALSIEVLDMDDATEVVLRWPWNDVKDINGMKAPNADEMDTLTLSLKRVGDIVFECDDAAAACSILERCQAEHLEIHAPEARVEAARTSEEKAAIKKQQEEAAMRQQTKKLRGALLTILTYLTLGHLFYSTFLGEVDGNTGKAWTFIDSFYFGIATITTVGYGDLSPQTRSGRTIACVYVLVGVGVIGVALGRIAGYLLERKKQLADKLARMEMDSTKLGRNVKGEAVVMRRGEKVGVDNESRLRLRLAKKLKPCRKACGCSRGEFILYSKVLKALSPLVVFCFAGALVGMLEAEAWSLVDSVYWAIITMSSVGYGDISPKTQWGRLVAIFYIPVAVAALMSAIGNISSLTARHAHRNITSIKKLLEMDDDGNGEVTCAEFQLFMLKAMNKVSEGDLELLEEQFAKLDKSGDGMLSAQDITEEDDAAVSHIATHRIAV